MRNNTYWMPMGIKTVLALGFPDFKDYYLHPLFIRVSKKGKMDKREILAVGCKELPENAQIILKDFEITK